MIYTSWNRVLLKFDTKVKHSSNEPEDDDYLSQNEIMVWIREYTRYDVKDMGYMAMVTGGSEPEWNEIKKLFPNIEIIPDVIIPNF